MKTYLIAYIGVAVVFLGLDALWLTQMEPRLYAPDLGALLAAKPALAPAALFYVIYWLGVVWFCVGPALAAQSGSKAALNGAMFGLCAYATYDLTNQATLRIWSVRVTVADLGWGMAVTAAAAGASFGLTRLATRGIKTAAHAGSTR